MFCSMKLTSCLLSLYPIVPFMCLLISHSPQNLLCINFLLLFSYTLLPHLTLILLLALTAIHSLHNLFLYLHLVKLIPPHLHLLSLSLPHLSHLLYHNLSLSPPVLSPSPISDPSTTVSHVTSAVQVPSTTNSHPIVTRSKNGIYKPKAMLAKTASGSTKAAKPDYTITKPLSFKIAVQYPQWCTAMDEEFAALQRQGTWSLVPYSLA